MSTLGPGQPGGGGPVAVTAQDEAPPPAAEHQPARAAARAGRRRLRAGMVAVWVTRIAFLVLLIGLWQLLAARGTINPAFSGEPSSIWSSFIGLFESSTLGSDVWTTMQETLAGFAISVVLGILVAYWMVRLPFLERTFAPVATAANAVPRIALMPVFIIWFGLGPASKIFNVVSFVFFLVLLNSLSAFQQAQSDRDSLLLARTLGFSERQRMWKFVLPGTVPVLFATMELALIYSFTGAVIGEMLGGYNGLGVTIETDANALNTNGYFAVVLLVVIITLLLVQILRFIRERLLRWSHFETREGQAV
jgi:NitT/TauT family transport system permease protein